MPTIVSNIKVDFSSGSSSPDSSSLLTNFVSDRMRSKMAIRPLGKSIAPSHTKFNDELLSKYFDKKYSNVYFSTIAFKQQVAHYDNGVVKKYPGLKEQEYILRSIVCLLIKKQIVRNLWCVFELHKCQKWLHIHFLSTSKYELESYKRMCKKVFYKVVEDDPDYEFIRNSQAYRKTAFKIEGCYHINKTSNYMDKSSILSESYFPEIYYLYYTENNKKRFKEKVLEKNYRNFISNY